MYIDFRREILFYYSLALKKRWAVLRKMPEHQLMNDCGGCFICDFLNRHFFKGKENTHSKAEDFINIKHDKKAQHILCKYRGKLVFCLKLVK